MMSEQHIAIETEKDLRSKIHTIRGFQVMLDYDLAAVYGYTTKRFNEQIKNNLDRFDEEFRFQLTDSEFQILRSKISTSRWGGARYLPYAFTEQGIYMLMTVLKGDLAVRQSKALIKLFKQMKDYILQNQSILSSSELLKLSIQTHNNTEEIRQIKQQMVTRNDISTIIKDFTDPCIKKDYLFYNGQTVEAALAYVEIYSSAKKSIYIVDNYIGLKTLLLLKSVANNVKVTIFSDNVNKGLHLSELKDFRYEYPNIDITLKTTGGIYHDRYIIIDPNTNSETIYHCGGSSKDGGKRITSITKVEDKMLYRGIIETLQGNPTLQI